MKEQPVLVQLMGGFGNQLFQISQGLSLGGTNSQFYFYQRDFNADIDYLIRNLVKRGVDIVVVQKSKNRLRGVADRCIGILLSVELNKRRIIAPRISKVLLAKTASLILRNILPIQGVYVAKELGFVSISSGTKQNLLVGYFQTFRTTLDNSILLLIKDCLNDRSIEKRTLKHIGADDSLIIHIRLGDYLAEEKFGNLGIDYYLRALELIDIKTIDEVLIFSDDIERAKECFEVDFAKKIQQLLGFELELTWIQSVNASTLDTFNLMRTGRSFIIANSSFSWWAARLSNNEKAKVIAPYPWFRGMNSPSDLLPKTWIAIDSKFQE